MSGRTVWNATVEPNHRDKDRRSEKRRWDVIEMKEDSLENKTTEEKVGFST